MWTSEKKIVKWSALFGYVLLGIVTTVFELEMFIKVWIYAARAVLLIFGTINLPLLYVGNKTHYSYTFWLFAVHYWLDRFVGEVFTSKYLYGELYQFVTFIIVFTVGMSMGMILKKISSRCFSLLTGGR